VNNSHLLLDVENSIRKLRCQSSRGCWRSEAYGGCTCCTEGRGASLCNEDCTAGVTQPPYLRENPSLLCTAPGTQAPLAAVERSGWVFFFWHDEKLDPEKIGTALQMGSQWTPQRTPANGIAEDPGCKGPRRPQLAARTPITPALHCTSVCGQLAVQPTAQPEARSGAAVLKMDRKINKTDSRSESKFRKSVSPVIAVQTRLVYKKTLFICFSCRLIACGRGEGSHRE